MKSIRGLHWAYFKTDSAVLLDKLYKFEDKTFELGGNASFNIFKDRDTIAVHTTCYEQTSKVMGLKVLTLVYFAPLCFILFLTVLFVCIRVHIKLSHTGTCMYICMYLCTYFCTYACVYVCVHVCMYV